MKRVVVTYKAEDFSGVNVTTSDEFEAHGANAYLTVFNNDQGQLIVNNCSENPKGDQEKRGERLDVHTVAVYNHDVWESWKIVREEKEE